MYCCFVSKLYPTLLWPHGLWFARFLCPWDFPSKNTRMGCHFFSRGSSQPRDWTCTSYTGRRFFTTEPQGKPHVCIYLCPFLLASGLLLSGASTSFTEAPKAMLLNAWCPSIYARTLLWLGIYSILLYTKTWLINFYSIRKKVSVISGQVVPQDSVSLTMI